MSDMTETGKERTRYEFFVYLIVISYVGLIAYVTRDYYVDDAYIGFRYLYNFLAGNGLVFNPGQRVEGITNIGWIAFLLPFAALSTPPVSAKFLGGLLAVFTAIASFLIFRTVEKKNASVVDSILPILIISQFDFLLFSLTGMETALLSALFCVIIYLASFEQLRIVNAFLCSFAFLIHPESILIYPIMLAIDLGPGKNKWKKYIAPSIVFGCALALYTCLRYTYYSDVLPNTFYSKSRSVEGIVGAAYRFLNSTNSNIPAPFTGLFVLLFMAYGFITFWKSDRRMSAYVAAIASVGFIFCIYAPRDWTNLGRYFAPYVPIGYVLLWRGIIDITTRLFREPLGSKAVFLIIISCFTVLLVSNIMETGFSLRSAVVNGNPGFILTSKNLVEPSLWIRDNLPNQSTIACFRIGALGYYSKKNVFDYKFGLTDKEVARLTESNVDLANPLALQLRGLWRKRSPDFWLTDLGYVETVAKESGGTIDNFQIHGINYRLIKQFRVAENPDIYWALSEKFLQPE